MQIKLVLLFITIHSDHVQSLKPIVNTKQGIIEGTIHETGRFTCDAFLGIPYARPPIGERRFKKPVGVPNDKNATFAAHHMGSRCLQTIKGKFEFFDAEPESEDCLFLNIIRPRKTISSSGALPVMVFIHGGGFVSGSAIEHGIDGPCNNIVSKEVILVIIQYRLGVFGFISTGDSSATGNWGIWDQVEALKWVQWNIASFGGDPSSVTIFGESAGAFSVSILSFSDITQDLYHRSIQQSGSTLSPLFLKESLADCTRVLAEYGCLLKDPTSDETIRCLRSMPANELLELNYNVSQKAMAGETSIAGGVMSWVPVVDGDIIKHNGFNIHQGANSKPAIIGFNELEMGWFVQPPSYMSEIRQILPTVIEEDQVSPGLFQFMVQLFLPNSIEPEKLKAIQSATTHIYVNSVQAEKNKTLLLEQYIKLMSDLWFNFPSVLDASARKEAGAKVFMYNFDYYCKNIFPEDHKFKSSQHAFEMIHLFEINFKLMSCGEFDANDRIVGDKIATLFTNFAKTGNPNPVDPEWPAWVSVDEAYNYRIGLNSRVDEQYNPDRVLFWTKTVPNLLNAHQEL